MFNIGSDEILVDNGSYWLIRDNNSLATRRMESQTQYWSQIIIYNTAMVNKTIACLSQQVLLVTPTWVANPTPLSLPKAQNPTVPLEGAFLDQCPIEIAHFGRLQLLQLLSTILVPLSTMISWLPILNILNDSYQQWGVQKHVKHRFSKVFCRDLGLVEVIERPQSSWASLLIIGNDCWGVNDDNSSWLSVSVA